MASTEVVERSAWTNINFHYKFAVFKLVQNAYNDTLPTILSRCIIVKRDLKISTRARESLIVPRFNTRYMKDSLAYRGSVIWNTLATKHKDLANMTRRKDLVHMLRLFLLISILKFYLCQPLILNRKILPIFSVSS